MIKGIGVDIVNIPRLKEKEESFAKFILTEKEYAQYNSRNDKSKLEYLAGRFAAKEAFVKANGGIIKDYEILDDETGKPNCKIGHISIAHDGDYAIAYVIIEEKKEDK